MSSPTPPATTPTTAPDTAPATAPATASSESDRGPLRLRLVAPAGPGHLDGGWWPRSRDLAVEVTDLVENLPPGLGRVTRVRYSPADWDGADPHGAVATVETEVLPRDDTSLVDVRTTEHPALRLLVVPPSFDDADGEEALLAASTPGNAYSAGDLLAAVDDADHVDPSGLWHHDGSAGWGHDAASPPR